MFSYVNGSLTHYLINKSNIPFKPLYEKYISIQYETLMKMVLTLNLEEVYTNDIIEMLKLNNLPRVQIKNDTLPEKKDYEILSDYCHIKPEETIPKTLTSISPCCDGECCKDFSQLGPLSLETSHWNSKCCDRKGNIECNPSKCKCTDENCKNLSLFYKKYKKINEDVEERYTWGIDLYTYRNLLNLFPENFNGDEIKIHDFVEKSIMISLSKLGQHGNKISLGCKYILDNPAQYSYLDIELAEHLLQLYSSIEICNTEINDAFSKGIGIFCIQEKGIKQNELIAPYLGEIYAPYMWFEKQDIIKRKKLDKNLPDFYNIMLERMKCDEDGYDILMVDPNSKGNFASRMSHSCNPNCNTVLMVSDNKYTIGMFAMRDISKDEELTFDYNSVTEKEKEFYDAICLCSTFNCRGHYLILSNSIIFTEIINKFHSFLHRNAILMKACVMGNKELTEKEKGILDKYSVKSSLLKTAPLWLRRWSALILTFVDVEKELLPIILYKAEMQEKDEQEKKEKKIEKTNEMKKKKEKDKKKENSSHNGKSKKKEANGTANGSLHNSSKKKKIELRKKTNIFNYNFKDDYIWEKKSFACSSRQKILEEKKQQEIQRLKQLDEIKKKFEEEEAKKIQEEQNKAMEIEKKGEKQEIEEPAEQPQINNDAILINDPINEDDFSITNIDNDFLELQLESTNFSFLSEFNLQLEPDYDKELYESIKFQVAGITEQRIQNLAITLDKIKHLLSLIHSDEPPLKLLTEEDTFNFYCKNIRAPLAEKFSKLSTHELVASNENLNNLVKEILQKLSYNPITFISQNISYKKLNEKIRKNLLEVSSLIKQCAQYETSHKLVYYEGLGDILYLYAKTKIHFTPNQNVTGQYLSEKIQIRKRDVDISCLSSEFLDSPLDTVITEEKKEYENHYLWGQLVGWYKQTVDKPNASLSAERRGTLSYPELESFFVKDDNEKIFNYPCGGKENFYSKLIENTSLMWPVGNDWSFKNKFKVYGTVQFDAVYYENFYLNKIKQYVSDIVTGIL